MSAHTLRNISELFFSELFYKLKGKVVSLCIYQVKTQIAAQTLTWVVLLLKKKKKRDRSDTDSITSDDISRQKKQ